MIATLIPLMARRWTGPLSTRSAQAPRAGGHGFQQPLPGRGWPRARAKGPDRTAPAHAGWRRRHARGSVVAVASAPTTRWPSSRPRSLTLQAIAVPGDAVWTKAPEAVEPAGEAAALARPDLRLAVSLDQHQPTDSVHRRTGPDVLGGEPEGLLLAGGRTAGARDRRRHGFDAAVEADSGPEIAIDRARPGGGAPRPLREPGRSTAVLPAWRAAPSANSQTPPAGPPRRRKRRPAPAMRPGPASKSQRWGRAKAPRSPRRFPRPTRPVPPWQAIRPARSPQRGSRAR